MKKTNSKIQMFRNTMNECEFTYSFSTSFYIVYSKEFFDVCYGIYNGQAVLVITLNSLEGPQKLIGVKMPDNADDLKTLMRCSGIELPKLNVWNRNRLINNSMHHVN